MAWERMQSETEKKTRPARERIRGFMPFIAGANAEGTLEAIRIKEDGRGFFILRATKSAIVNVQEDDESKTGQGKAQIGELVGVRKTGATKILKSLKLGTLVSVTYVGLEEHVGMNPVTKQEENNPYHNITVDVYHPDNQQEGA
jgi:hypothetical protein